jgi:hypothetical protein
VSIVGEAGDIVAAKAVFTVKTEEEELSETCVVALSVTIAQ